MKLDSGHSTGDNIAVYSGRVGGKFEWALEPSRKSSAAGQQQGGLFFDDSMQLAPSVISLMNFPAPVVAVEVKKYYFKYLLKQNSSYNL